MMRSASLWASLLLVMASGARATVPHSSDSVSASRARRVTTRRGPVDPRLMRLGRGVRAHMALTVVLGGITALLVIAQAWLLADVIARAFDGTITVADVRSATHGAAGRRRRPCGHRLVYGGVGEPRVEPREVAAARRARREARR